MASHHPDCSDLCVSVRKEEEEEEKEEEEEEEQRWR